VSLLWSGVQCSDERMTVEQTRGMLLMRQRGRYDQCQRQPRLILGSVRYESEGNEMRGTSVHDAAAANNEIVQV